jgi:hypothetical protein
MNARDNTLKMMGGVRRVKPCSVVELHLPNLLCLWRRNLLWDVTARRTSELLPNFTASHPRRQFLHRQNLKPHIIDLQVPSKRRIY